MLPRKYRLPSSVVFQNADVYKEDAFFLKIQANNLPFARFGFIASKSIDKKAVVRNRVRRVFRSVIEESWKDGFSGKDMLFILRPSIKDMDFAKIKEKVNLVLANI